MVLIECRAIISSDNKEQKQIWKRRDKSLDKYSYSAKGKGIDITMEYHTKSQTLKFSARQLQLLNRFNSPPPKKKIQNEITTKYICAKKRGSLNNSCSMAPL